MEVSVQGFIVDLSYSKEIKQNIYREPRLIKQ